LQLGFEALDGSTRESSPDSVPKTSAHPLTINNTHMHRRTIFAFYTIFHALGVP
jgi:hypothetical protein